ncbi:MAG: IS66 family transposase [Alphaproteobacteria bacterium]|nr:MAG: IS66 family transposase [Alphaproteobacteria bacterium]
MELSPELRELIEGLRREIAVLRSENAALKQEVADLRRQLGKDSSNSSKPPSSDGLGKKPRIAGSLRGASGKKSGGQAGHKGGTLRRVETPNIIKHHTAENCAHCRAKLTSAMADGVEKRQVFDIPEPRLEVTEHQAHIYTCAKCHGTTQAAFPEDVTSFVQYGARIKAAAVYLNAQQLIPEDRAAEVMNDVFGAKGLCPDSIVAWGKAKAAALQPFVEHIRKLLDAAPVRHLDETGFRIGGKTQWLHVVSTTALTHYRASEKRGTVPRTLQGGVIVHDHFKPYYTLAGLTHGLCNAHHLRELKALTEIEKEPWAKKMFRFLLLANKAAHRAKGAGMESLPERVKRRLMSLYDAIIMQGWIYHENLPPLAGRRVGQRGKQARRPGFNLLRRLRDFKQDALRFLEDFAVPFTNNQAEQDIRMMKVKMKISGGFRTMDGATTFASLRSVLSTARKQGWNILKTLASKPETLVSALPA